MRNLWLSCALVLLLLTACQPYAFKGTAYPEGVEAEDFTMTTTEGRPFRLSEQHGQVVLMFFGFTSCPDVCPTTLSEARRILEGLEEDAQNVHFVFITVDPERDTPDKLGKYVSNFHPEIVGLTGSPEEDE